jgi:16S rRNA U516 pseudouridylate synthase RsuA-like enzyme
MFEATENRLVAIARVGVAGIALGDLAPGQYRLLTEDELASLRPAARKS